MVPIFTLVELFIFGGGGRGGGAFFFLSPALELVGLRGIETVCWTDFLDLCFPERNFGNNWDALEVEFEDFSTGSTGEVCPLLWLRLMWKWRNCLFIK